MTVADPNDIEAFLTDDVSSASRDEPEALPPVAPVGRTMGSDGQSALRASPEETEPKVSVDDSAGAMTRRLLVPLKVDGVDLSEVSVRMASLGDIDDWGSGRLKTNRDLLARLTGLHPAVLRALKWADAEAVIKLFEAAVPAFVIDEMGRPE